jgi:hypothetical protein
MTVCDGRRPCSSLGALGDDAGGQGGIELQIELEVAALGFVPDRAPHGVEQVGERDLLGLDGDGDGPAKAFN